MLQSADFQPADFGRIRVDRQILYMGTRLSKADLLKRRAKPLNRLEAVSFSKRLNKFLVSEARPLPGGNLQEKEEYLTSRPAWERVDLELKIE